MMDDNPGSGLIDWSKHVPISRYVQCLGESEAVEFIDSIRENSEEIWPMRSTEFYYFRILYSDILTSSFEQSITHTYEKRNETM